MKKMEYLGHPTQACGVEVHRLCGGRGDGMRLYQIRNGKGISMTVSADRCADISRLEFKGINCGFFSPCGYVAPAHYDNKGTGYLGSFTAGFLTTCGLNAAGQPCTDQGQELPLHGAISHMPAEDIRTDIDGDWLRLSARVNQARIFSEKLELRRTLSVSLADNRFTIEDTVTNLGGEPSPIMLLYHFNIGYPLLDENALLHVPSKTVRPRNDHAAQDLATWNKMPPPTAGFEEQCYYHGFEGAEGHAAIFNPVAGCGLSMTFDRKELDHFVQWKMPGVRDYVLGLEPSNCHCEGRDKMRAEGKLKFLEPGQSRHFKVGFELFDDQKDWERVTQK